MLSQRRPEHDAAAVDLIRKLLVFDARGRVGAAEALAHPYFSDLHDSDEEHVVIPFRCSLAAIRSHLATGAATCMW
jgi:serine/threonine protein kinase